jgi:hypothetical protein
MCTQQLWCVTCIYAWHPAAAVVAGAGAQGSSLCTNGANYRPCTTKQVSATSKPAGAERHTMLFLSPQQTTTLSRTVVQLLMFPTSLTPQSNMLRSMLCQVLALDHTTPTTPTPAGHQCTPHPPLSHKVCLSKCGDAAFGPWCMRCCCAIHALTTKSRPERRPAVHSAWLVLLVLKRDNPYFPLHPSFRIAATSKKKFSCRTPRCAVVTHSCRPDTPQHAK